MDRSQAEQVTVGLGHVGRAGGIVGPGADSGRRGRGVVLGVAELVEQVVDGGRVGGACPS
ncbi:hypothetical protein [Actinophytocola sediminis]